MTSFLAPTDSQRSMLMSLPMDAPLGVFNLFLFHTTAQYKEGDPEFGTAKADVTGEQAYARYANIAGKMINDLGGRMVFSSPVNQIMIGPDNPKWNKAAIMYFPTRQAFMDMLTDPEFQKTSRHRKAALAQHYMMHLSGDPFKS